jgi:hypothetical protein
MPPSTAAQMVRKENPIAGDLILFKHRGGWAKGIVVQAVDGARRITISLDDFGIQRTRTRHYQRSRSQIFERFAMPAIQRR